MSNNQEETNKQLFDLENQEFMNMTLQELLLLKHQYKLDKEKVEDYKQALRSREQLIAVMEDFQESHKAIIRRLRTKIEKAFYLLEKNKLTKLSRLLSKMIHQ